ncbi:MAG TPA: DNA gyrase C-terminal beta-propeller domain-containing protein, partial [Solirubrobacteraceae bacterium]
AGALVVREHQELVFISVGGMVQRTAAGGISQQGRSATGVRVMNLKDDDLVSAVALVVDTGEQTAAPVAGEEPLDGDSPAEHQDAEAVAPGDAEGAPEDPTEA